MQDVKQEVGTSEMAKVLGEIRKRYGERSAVSGTTITQPWRIPTGIFTFDYATLGGIPHNRVIQFSGAKHSGKTTGALRCIAGAQRSLPNQQAVIIDVEGTYDRTWGEKVGVDNESLLVIQPDTGEQAVDITDALVRTRETSLIVIDSLAAMLPTKEQDSSAEDSLVGLQSRLITSMMRKINAAMVAERKRDHFVTVLVINQQRTKIGGWSPTGEPISLPGGKAVGFFSTLEVVFKNKENMGKDAHGFETLTHNDHAFQITKNKLNAGMRSGEFRMLRQADESLGLSEGDIDDASTLIAFAKRLGWYGGAGKGQWLRYEDVDLSFTSADNAVSHLYDDRDAYWHLRTHLIADNARRLGQKEEFVEYLLSGLENGS